MGDFIFSDHTFYDTMAHNDKELNELLRKGRAVAVSLGNVYDRTQMDAVVKEGHTDPAKMDLDQCIKQGQTVIKSLDNASSINNLDHLLQESIELFGQTNQNGPKVSLFDHPNFTVIIILKIIRLKIMK